MDKQIYIEHMGACRASGLDARLFEKYFQLNGFKITKNIKKANCILFIACAVKKNYESLAIARIKELRNYKSRLIVGGCLKGINDEILNDPNIESFVTSNNEYIDTLFPNSEIKFNDIPDANILYPESKLRQFKKVYSSRINIKPCLSFFKTILIYLKEKTSLFKPYYIRICRGCINIHCTYCHDWRAVGKLRSKPIETCLEEFHNAIIKNYKNIFLVGENPGAYGLDIGQTFPSLLNRFIEIDGDYKIQLDFIHPMWIVKYINELIHIFQSGKIGIVHCPIQSCNNRILQLMNRNYNIYEVKDALMKLKTAYPPLRFYTHIIVGFPSETEEEFEDTLNIVKEIGFESIGIFPFSKNSELPVEYLEWEIPDQVIKDRLTRAVSFFHKYDIACTIG